MLQCEQGKHIEVIEIPSVFIIIYIYIYIYYLRYLYIRGIASCAGNRKGDYFIGNSVPYV